MNPAETAGEKPLLEHACGLWQARAEAEGPSRDEALLAHARGWLQDTDSPDTAGLEWARAEHAGDRIDHYTLLEPLGEGGFGIVWMAEQLEPVRRRVALKIIKLGMDTREVIARFEQERQALALMGHPHIAAVFDVGATRWGRPFFVMEWVRGVRITEYCDAENLTVPQRLELFVKVCQAVQHAHQKGTIHRDLKPSNILVTQHDGAPMPKVIDFGVAKATQSRLTAETLCTQADHMLGTPLYMSPEQAGGNSADIDTRSDIYSLGVLLYELLTGRTPFDPETLLRQGHDEMRRVIREVDPPRPSSVARSRGALAPSGSSGRGRPYSLTDLDWIVMKALEKDRTRRYETANALALDIQRHLASEPVLARPASQLYRLRRLVRRNRVAFAAAGAVVAALIAGLSVATYSFFKERAAHNSETLHRGIAEQRGREAQASESKAKHFLYASDMSLAQQALNQHNLGKARRLLDRHRPQPGEEDLRGWEWRYLWQLSRGSTLATLTHRPTRGFSLSFSPDGTRLAVGWYDGYVELWDVPNRRMVRALTEREYPHQGRVAFSPVRNLLAATSGPKTVTLYDFDSTKESILWRAPDQGAWAVRDLEFSRDGSKLVIFASSPSPLLYGGSPQALSAAVWVVDVASSRIESHCPTTFSGADHFGAARLSPDNRRLYLARINAAQRIYSIGCIDLTTGRELWQSEHDRDAGLSTLDISPDGRVLASGSGFEDTRIRIWDAATGQRLHRLVGHTGWVCKVAFTKDGRRLISAARDQSVRFWDTSNWTEIQALRGHTDEVHTLAISERAQLVASGGKDGSIMLWSAEPKRAKDGYRALPVDLKEVELVPLDHSRVLLLHSTQRPELVDLAQDTPPRSVPEIASADVVGLFGNHVLQWSGPRQQIEVRELVGSEFVRRGFVTVNSAVRPAGCAYHPSCTHDGQIRLFDPAKGEVIDFLHGHLRSVFALAFSSDGQRLISTSGGAEAVKLWDVSTRQELLTLAGKGATLRAPRWSADGNVILVGAPWQAWRAPAWEEIAAAEARP